MLEHQSYPTPESFQPLLGDKIYEIVLDRRPDYSEGLSWGPKAKSRKRGSSSSSSYEQDMHAREVSELRASVKMLND